MCFYFVKHAYETKDKIGAVRSQAGDDDKAPPFYLAIWSCMWRLWTGFDNLCGEDLVKLYTLRAEDPLCFLEQLDQYCDASSVDRLKFTQALDEISAFYQ
nr:hypothetical protein BaRGS_007967 [Batillaria attramentaria]